VSKRRTVGWSDENETLWVISLFDGWIESVSLEPAILGGRSELGRGSRDDCLGPTLISSSSEGGGGVLFSGEKKELS
jgi:hypothetical protein